MSESLLREDSRRGVEELRRVALAGIPEGDAKPLHSARIAVTLLADRLATIEAERAAEALVWEALTEWRELEESPVQRGFRLDDAKAGFDEAWATYRKQRERYDRDRGRRT